MEGPSSHNTATVPYIGSRISLISNVDIRYEGVLHSIDTYQSTVALQNVRSLGTEGRRQPEIPPNHKTYQYIIFKGKDIKDLTVCEPAANSRIPEDPAVVSVNIPPSTPSAALMSGGPPMHHQSQPISQRQMPTGPEGGQSYGPGMMGYGMPPNGRMGHHNHNSGFPMMGDGPMSGYTHHGHRGSLGGMMPGGEENVLPGGYGRGGRFAGRGGMLGQRRGRGGGPRRVVGQLPPQPNMAIKKEVSKAFDFESANAKFDKSEIAKTDPTKTENANGVTLKPARTGYDKTASFFDNISCETLDRQSGQDSRVDREKQRQLDCDTFGPTAAAYRRGFRRGGSNAGRPRGSPTGFGGYRGGPPAARYVPVATYMGGGGGGGYGAARGY